ncbi:MAG: tetratricopeptide repeat protein [Gemmatimonadota bacterium]|nr:tetratricopeptide repeat protein [Gemmatimonadota bacterium]
MAPLAVVLAALAAWGVWQASGADDAGAVPEEQRSIAVLPFTPIGVDEEPDVFAEGLHSDLVTRLSTASTLDVISITSVRQFRDRNVSLPTIADTLGARWVLEGEVQRRGDRLGVNVQLIDPRTDRHVWAESFRRDLTAENYFALQDEISGHVVDVLDARLGQAVTRPRGPIEDLEAYRFYVRGRSLLEQRDPEQMRRSLEYFDQALATDSAYARAWAGRANALSILARYPTFGPDTLLPKAEEAVRRALELDSDRGEAHAALGRLHMYRREGPAALDAFRRAIELQPSFAEAHAWLAKLQLSLGMPEEALASVHRAVKLDPLSPENLGTLVFVLLAGDRPDSALAVSRRIGDLAEGSGWIYEAHVHGHQGRLEEMRSAFQRSGSELRELPVYATRAAALGEPSLAREMLDELRPGEEPFEAALLRAGLGDADRALELLGALYPRDDRPWDLFYSVYLRYLWPATLDPVRELPGYDSLIREMNVEWGLTPEGSLPDTAKTVATIS